ncbi:MAG TPA: sensor histidine kinase [Candidatus Acidoferrum sp.]|nr:sensor histidine kinase [Candidatus Acidoferrum sp.]
MASIGSALGPAIERERSEEGLRSVTSKLLNAQDDERRRLARELHDTTAQDIALLIMNLDRVANDEPLSPRARARLAECAAQARQSLQEIRALSYMLPPPLLDELEILSAVRVFVEGFCERSGLKVDLDLPERSIRMPKDLETTIFRVVQEGLTNVHKHSRSPTAKVQVKFEGLRIAVLVEDQGLGMSEGSVSQPGKVGVGIGGMRERVKQRRGQLTLNSRPSGTLLEVCLPLPETAKSATA